MKDPADGPSSMKKNRRESRGNPAEQVRQATLASRSPFVVQAGALALIVASFFAATSLPGAFYYDDIILLDELRGRELSLSSLFDYSIGRPLTVLSFVVNLRLAGYSSTLFHLTNILLHALNTLLVACLFFSLTGKRGVALLSGAVFALHFVSGESVNYLWARSGLLSACFLFLGLLVLATNLKPLTLRRSLLIALILALGFLCRPDILLFIPLGFFLVAVFTGRIWDPWYPFFLVLTGGAVVIVSLVLGSPDDKSMGFDLGYGPLAWARVAGIAAAKYLEFLVRADRISLLHQPPAATLSLWMGVVCGLLATLVVVLKRRDKPIVYAGLWILVCLIFINLVPTSDVVAERRFYPGMAGVGLLSAGVLEQLRARARLYRYLTGSLLVALMLVAGFRNYDWNHPPRVLWKAEALYPQHPKVQFMLAMHFNPLDSQEAATYFENTVRRDPEYPDAHNNLGNIYMNQERWTEAERQFREELRHRPDAAHTYNNLGVLFARQNRVPEAAACFRSAIKLRGDYPVARQNLQMLLKPAYSAQAEGAAQDK